MFCQEIGNASVFPGGLGLLRSQVEDRKGQAGTVGEGGVAGWCTCGQLGEVVVC